MSVFLQDNFNNNEGNAVLSLHPPDIGGTWTRYTPYGTATIGLRGGTTDGYARMLGNNANTYYYNTVDPGSDVYSVSLGLDQNNVNDQTGPAVVADATGANMVFARYNAGKLQLLEQKAGATTQNQQSSGTWTPSIGNDVLTISIDSNRLVTAKIGDGSVVSVSLTTTITGRGKVAIVGFQKTELADNAVAKYRDMVATNDLTNLVVSPSPGSALVNGAIQFSSGGVTVTWSVQEAGGGTINSSGLYTAPANAGVYHVVATPTTGSPVVTTVNVTGVVAPAAPTITIVTAGGNDTITTGAAAAGTNAVSEYRLYVGSTPGGQSGTAVATRSTPGAFAAQTTAPAGQSRYYTVKAADSAGNLSPASNEISSTTAGSTDPTIVTSNVPRVTVADYGSAGAGQSLGYTIRNRATNAVIQAYTKAGVSEVLPGRYTASFSAPGNIPGYALWDAPNGAIPVEESYGVQYATAGTGGGGGGGTITPPTLKTGTLTRPIPGLGGGSIFVDGNPSQIVNGSSFAIVVDGITVAAGATQPLDRTDPFLTIKSLDPSESLPTYSPGTLTVTYSYYG